MARSKRTAFTLVELLVVITIIGMLMAILLPAVGAATESARAAQCKSRVKNIALAMVNYESRNQGFPGYIDGVETRDRTPMPFSWLIGVLPDLERQDIYDQVTDERLRPQFEAPFLDFLICPSDPPLEKVALTSYVANAGLEEEDAPGCGVLHTALPIRSPSGQKKKLIHQRTTVDKVSSGDGASNTIMVSENIQAGRWDGLSFLPPTFSEQVPAEKAANGQPPSNVMVWRNMRTSDFPAYQINSSAPGGGNWPPNKPEDARSMARSGNLSSAAFARPSSEHRGGVQVAFVDGHVQFLKDSISYEVYALLMSPDGKKCQKDLVTHSHRGDINQLRVLTDTDYK